jgi:ribosomal protein L11 methyltransferase
VTWIVLEVRAPEAVREGLAPWLVEHTGQAVEEREDGVIVGFVPDSSAYQRLIRELSGRFGPAVMIERRDLPEVDWSVRWREGLGPRSIGRLTIVPSWIEYAPAEGETVVVLDPETAFGSGEHGSTRATLRLLDHYLKPGDFLLDLGSGSGILAIAGARLGAGRAVGIEIDKAAEAVAERNATLNFVADRTAFFTGDASSLALLFGPVDLVTSNILRTVNVSLLPTVYRVLRRGGTAIFSGMERDEAGEFRAPLLAAGFQILTEHVDGEWWAVAAERA